MEVRTRVRLTYLMGSVKFPPFFGQVVMPRFWHHTSPRNEGAEMRQKHKRHADDFKARVALEAVRGIKTLGELSSTHGVHPTVIAHWKRQLVAGAPSVFARGDGGGMRTEEEIGAPLYQEIGRLKMEVDWLKKKL